MSAPQPVPTRTIELDLQGMTCASCERRIDKALRGVPGVTASDVNLVTERATVTVDPARATPERLVAAVERAGYQATLRSALRETDEHEDTPASGVTPATRRGLDSAPLVFAVLLTAPLLVLAMSHGAWAWTESDTGRFVQFLLATPVVFGPGARFSKLAWKAARSWTADMNTLVSLGVLSAWGYSTVALAAPQLFPHGEHGQRPHLYYEAAATIVTFVLLGKRLEERARRQLGDAVHALHRFTPPIAHRIDDDREVEVEVAALRPGDRVRVRPGERVPTDGIVLDGRSAVDESAFSGESLPIDKAPGDEVWGGALNRSGSLVVKIERTGADTVLARIVAAVEAAQGSRAPIARLADQVSGYFVPIVLLIALATFGLGYVLQPSAAGFSVALERAVAVLVIACPCALGLATPAAVAAGTSRAAELGVLFKGGAVLESAARIDTVFLDKTGTLTRGEPELVDVVVAAGFDPERVLRHAAVAEHASEHPIARAIVAGASRRGVEWTVGAEFRSVVGSGVVARSSGIEVRVGNRSFLEEAGVATGELEARAEESARRGGTPVFVALDGELAGLLVVADRPAPEARAVVAALRDMGIRVVMLTGDRRGTAAAVAAELSIDEFEAELRPEDKARVVANERARGRRVAMVGDGVNDASSLATAEVGIAMGHGTDVAVAAADVVLLRGGIAVLPTVFDLARATLSTIRRNLGWAFVYNVLGVPVAAGALLPWTDWTLSPMLASAAMSLSSVSVLASSLTLRRYGRTTAPNGSRN